jgi:hypothetical protein
MRLLDFAGLRDVADCAVLAHGGSHLALSSLIACFRDALVFGYPDHWRRIRYLRSCFAPDAPGFLNYPQLSSRRKKPSGSISRVSVRKL